MKKLLSALPSIRRVAYIVSAALFVLGNGGYAVLVVAMSGRDEVSASLGYLVKDPWTQFAAFLDVLFLLRMAPTGPSRAANTLRRGTSIPLLAGATLILMTYPFWGRELVWTRTPVCNIAFFSWLASLYLSVCAIR